MKTALDEAFILERLPVRASWACVQAYGRHVPRHRWKALVEAVLTGTGTTTLLRPALAEKADQIPEKNTFFFWPPMCAGGTQEPRCMGRRV